MPGGVRGLWLVTALAACVPSRSSVFSPVDAQVERRVGFGIAWREPDARTQAAVADLLAKPLDLDASVRIALAQNQRLQARFDELGIAASAIADATVLPPATADFDYKRAIDGSGSEVELVVVQDFLDLIQVGQRRGIAGAELRAAQARAVSATIELAEQVEVAFYDLVAAKQDLELVQTASDAASASAEVVERQHAAGNTTDLALAREREMRERMRVAVSEAEQTVAEASSRLAALLGLDGTQPWTTIARLPDAPATAPDLDDLEATATDASLALAALDADADAARSRHSYAMVRAVVPELGAGVAVARRDGGDWELGPAIRIGIPLFDQQQGPRARARAEESRAIHEASATRTELHAETERVRSRVEHAFSQVRQLADTVMPLRQRVLDETVLQYNAMNASTFELLTARREMVDVGRDYIDALHRYWTAVAESRALQRGGDAGIATEKSL